MALILQPDTAQVTAFACTAVLSFAFMGFSWTRLITAVILAVCTAGSWMRPDPLAPVLHVEGVLDLAWQIHPTLFGLSLLSLCLPCITLFWKGKHQQAEYFSVAFYYLLMGFLAAFTQMTPMPILGFGAGPILGYFLMLSFAHRTQNSSVRNGAKEKARRTGLTGHI